MKNAGIDPSRLSLVDHAYLQSECHCAGKLRLVEIATEPTAIKRIMRDERRRRGEPVSEMEARAPPRGPPGQLLFAFR